MASGDTERSPIRQLLIANRGEITVRIAATARRLGVGTVGVFSEPDRHALHVDAVDIAVALGGSSPSESYLRGDAIIDAARRTGADAIHPGYGFLAENADFAQAVIDAGLTWVGPRPEHIELLGDKVAAKHAAAEAGVPSSETLTVADDGAVDVDALPPMPVLIKAAAGGGGRGMRVVRERAELDDAIAAARREAQGAFGDPTVFIEPYITGARHIEVQIFGDQSGAVVHLGERDCSVQRRNQKVIEEAPAARLDPDVRARLTAGAVALARRVGYVGAGTVEYLVAAGDDPVVTFLEVNTRLQVEHPVTEAICGFDLVEWQLLVASGQPLPATQAEIDTRLNAGQHAIEARIIAEDPDAGWMPSTGTIARWTTEATPPSFDADRPVRVDTGVETGAAVSPDYDSLLAKIIAVGPDRATAIGRLRATVSRTVAAGIQTNAAMILKTLDDPIFADGAVSTSYLDDGGDRITSPVDDHVLLAAVFAYEAYWRRADTITGFAPAGWRNLVTRGQQQRWRVGTHEIAVEYWRGGHDAEVAIGEPPPVQPDGTIAPDDRHKVAVRIETSVQDADVDGSCIEVTLEVQGVRTTALVYIDGEHWTVVGPAGSAAFVEVERFVDHDAHAVGGGPISPLPGTVIDVRVADGDVVDEGAVLVVVEAMKMEHQIAAPVASVVERVCFGVGERVDAGDVLVELAAVEPDPDQTDDATAPERAAS